MQNVSSIMIKLLTPALAHPFFIALKFLAHVFEIFYHDFVFHHLVLNKRKLFFVEVIQALWIVGLQGYCWYLYFGFSQLN